MDGKGNRGAYAQVTAPIGDDAQVTVNQGGKGQGTSAFCTKTRLICAVITAVVLIIIIIIVAIVVQKNNKSAQSVEGTTLAPSVTPEVTTTQPPPTTTTFGPAVRGSFKGSFVFNRSYVQSFDDARVQGTIDFIANVSAAIHQVFDSSAPYMYVQTDVDRLLQNGTNVAAEFTVSIDAINRGASTHLRDTLGRLPSTVLNTYPVLIADIKPEEPLQTDA